VLRIGLQADHGLDAESIRAGCWHPALGQLVRSQLYADLISRMVSSGQRATVYCNPARLSDVIGVRRVNVLNQLRRGVQVLIAPDAALEDEELTIQIEDSRNTYSIITDLHYSIHEV
ncbi:MAG: hypothetical protein PHH28_15035, partial [Desulfuromonadaceae bacterium]|nr:hypothetical protein [Desulfuromonadaceae bacterium]